MHTSVRSMRGFCRSLFLTAALLACLLPAVAVAATHFYRSVGPGTSGVLDNGTGNAMTISGDDATFSAAVASGVGVGDVIQYDSDADTVIDALAVINSRVSSTHYLVTTPAGGTPAPVAAESNWNIRRAYLSLANAAQGLESTGIVLALRDFDNGGHNLITGDEVWHFACYNSSTDTAKAQFAGWTTGPNNYLHIFTPSYPTEVGNTQQHAGVWNTGVYYMQVTDDTAIDLGSQARHVKLEGLQIEVAGVSGSSCCAIYLHPAATAGVEISNVILKGNRASTAYRHDGIFVDTPTGSSVKIWNSVLYDFSYAGIEADCAGTQVLVYNTTVDNCGTGYKQVAGNVYLKNTLAQDCSANDGYDGTFNAASDYNLSDFSGDAPGANSRNGLSVVFVNATAKNFHLAGTDASARDFGQDLSADPLWPFNNDLDRQYRYGTWDIGADEYNPGYASPTATLTITRTYTATRTTTPTPTLTATPTISATLTHSATWTRTRTVTATRTATPTRTSSPTPFPTPTATATPTVTQPATPSCTPTLVVIPAGEVVAYPQPASGDTLYFYFLAEAPASASLEIYNLMGERVAVLSQTCEGGAYARVPWSLSPVAPGIYLYRLRLTYADREQTTAWRKLVVVKKR